MKAVGKEEKKTRALESKSIKLLEKYKIRDDAYSLLHSSGIIGQVGSTREKHIRAIQFSKAGLEVPVDVKPFKRKGKQSADCSDKVAMEFYPDQSHLEQPCICNGLQQKEKGIDGVTCIQFLGTDGKTTCKSLQHREPCATLPVPESSGYETGTCRVESERDLPLTPCGNGRREATISQIFYPLNGVI